MTRTVIQPTSVLTHFSVLLSSFVPSACFRLCAAVLFVASVVIHMPGGSTHELRKSDQVYPDTGTLYMPDGTRYVLDNGSGQIIDRNGNTISFDGSTRQWTDTLGRAIGMPWPAGPQATDYYYTPPGTTAPYIFKWRNLSSALTPDAQG